MDIDYVMYCVFSKEAIKAMGGNRGKLASMAGHAYLHSFWDAQKDAMKYKQSLITASLYKTSGLAKKVTLVVDTTEELMTIYDTIKDDMSFGKTLVVDRGLTVFNEPTTVCIGVGPVQKDNVPEVLRTLKVLI